jgi:hypothetical protein
MMLRKWYFAANYNALSSGFDQIQGAVMSARKYSSLSSHCIVDETAFGREFEDKLNWLKDNNVNLIRHTSELFPAMISAHGESIRVFSGHWLRCDIPILEKEEEFVLYTDIDVIFRDDPAKIEQRPAYIAAAPEHGQDDKSYFNSGVMILNVPALLDTRNHLAEDVRVNAAGRAGHDDQGALNNAYRAHWELIPNIWNWKPYWGVNEDACLVHFVGPKPSHARIILAGKGAAFGEPYVSMVEGAPQAYRHYIEEFDRIIAGA